MTESKTILIVGGTRGLGASLAKQYAEKNTVFATARSSPKDTLASNIKWIPNIDVAAEDAGKEIVDAHPNQKYDIVIVTAGYFGKESFDEPNYDAQLTMYKTSAIGPVFLTQSLVKSNALTSGSKVILVSSEAGSIALRHESEGGGMYGHHASKAAMNMVGKLLSFDLKDKGIVVGLVHPGFMRTEMTRSVGFDQFWDSGGAVTPDVAAESLREWVDGFGIERSGELWAPRGPADIGTAEPVMGSKDKLSAPLKLPW